jgi:hypothetical protein
VNAVLLKLAKGQLQADAAADKLSSWVTHVQ